MKVLCVNCILLSLLAIITISCEKKAEISSPTTYNNFGLSFEYPSNWEITGEFPIQQQGSLLGASVYLVTPGKVTLVLAMTDSPSSDPDYAGESKTIEKAVKLKEDAASHLSEKELTIAKKSVEKDTLQVIEASKVVTAKYFCLSANVKQENLSKVEPGFDLIFNSAKVSE